MVGRLALMPDSVRVLVYSFTPFCSKHQLVPLHLLPLHAAFHGINLSQSPQPSLGRAGRFLRAVHIIERAIGFVAVPARGRRVLSRHEADMDSMFEHMATLRPCPPPFHFYVAGGFVVSEVFGFGDWGDIDVWFQPARFQGSAWTVPQRKSPWPVQVMVVTDPQAHIACFDLHICQCAIHCQVLQGRRRYELCLTPACWEAILHRRAHMAPLRGGARCQWTLWARVLKYEKRGLRRPAGSLPPAGAAASRSSQTLPWRSVRRRVLAQYTCCRLAGSYWVIEVQGNRVAQVRWQPEWALAPIVALCARGAEDMVSSRPALAYACAAAPEMLGVAPVPFRQSPFEKQWPISFPGGTLWRSDQLVPEWFIVRRHLSDGALTAAVRALLQPVSRRDLTNARFVLRCAWPASVYLVVKDWVIAPTNSDSDAEDSSSEAPYGAGQGPQWGLRMDVCNHDGIQCHMFCASSRTFCARCEHGDEQAALVFGSACTS